MGKSKRLQAALSPAGAAGDHYLCALLPRRYQLRYQGGRILEVAVHDDDRLALGDRKPGADGLLVAPVARQVSDHHGRGVGLVKPGEEAQGLVFASIVDVDDLPGFREAGHDLVDVGVQPLQQEFLVIDRNDDGDDASTLPALLDLLQRDSSTKSENVRCDFSQHSIKRLHPLQHKRR